MKRRVAAAAVMLMILLTGCGVFSRGENHDPVVVLFATAARDTSSKSARLSRQPARDVTTRPGSGKLSTMEIVDRLWRQQLDRALGSAGNEQPEHLKIRVFGAPAVAQQRLAEAIDALRTKSYVFADTNAVATSPWFTVTDVRFTRNQTRA